MSASVAEELRRFVRNCDPQRPLEADAPLYVPFDGRTPRIDCQCSSLVSDVIAQ